MYDGFYCIVQKRTWSTVCVEIHKTQHKYVVGHKELVSRRSWLLQVTLSMSISWNNCIHFIGVSVEMPSSESDSSAIALRGPPEKLGLALIQVYKKVHFLTTKLNLFYI